MSVKQPNWHHYVDHYSQKTWSELGVEIKQEGLHIDICFPYPITGQQADLRSTYSFEGYGVTWHHRIMPILPQNQLPRHPKIKNVIAVNAGKGGVGKSTVALNLALALIQEGAQVGLLDADIYGPSQPHLLGLTQRATTNADSQLVPQWRFGLPVMSMGLLIDPEQAAVWRGPMATQALQQLFFQTAWPELDYLVVDMPPGTGDIPLSLAQKIPLSAALLVTTPQQLAWLDVRRGHAMLNKLGVHTLGVVINMAGHTCSACGHYADVLGQADQIEVLFKDRDLQVLGQIPLSEQIASSADRAQPIVLSQPSGHEAKAYQELARTVAARLSCCPKDRRLPQKVIVQT